MNILSLFDGMSCGQIALNRIGLKYENYFSSEIDKWAITVTQKNYPKTIQLGDVQNVKAKNLPKIDLLIGGSPCQGFSSSGKGLNFKDPRSKLFFEFVRLLEECNPTYFMLENVSMKKEWVNIISNYLQVEPVMINSSFVSAQHRKRFYWINITKLKQPKNLNTTLQDILEDDTNFTYNIQPIEGVIKERLNIPTIKKPILLNINEKGKGMSGRVLSPFSKKSHALTASGANWIKYGFLVYEDNEPKYLKWRQLTVTEWERLQTVPEGYTEGAPNYQRCKMLGNGWTIDVICFIFNHLKDKPKPIERKPLTLLPFDEVSN